MKMFDPKEEARKLVEDFIPYVAEEDFHGNKVELYFAKQCATIAVKRVLLVLECELLDLYDGARTCDVNNKYQSHYLEVLKEIEKL